MIHHWDPRQHYVLFELVSIILILRIAKITRFLSMSSPIFHHMLTKCACHFAPLYQLSLSELQRVSFHNTTELTINLSILKNIIDGICPVWTPLFEHAAISYDFQFYFRGSFRFYVTFKFDLGLSFRMARPCKYNIYWCLFICNARWSDLEKHRSHCKHLNGLAPVCFR